MKVDIDKKHPFTSVKLIPEEGEEEYLTEYDMEKFRKIGIRLSRIQLFAIPFFGVFAIFFELLTSISDLAELGLPRVVNIILGVLGIVSLIGTVVSAVFFGESP